MKRSCCLPRGHSLHAFCIRNNLRKIERSKNVVNILSKKKEIHRNKIDMVAHRSDRLQLTNQALTHFRSTLIQQKFTTRRRDFSPHVWILSTNQDCCILCVITMSHNGSIKTRKHNDGQTVFRSGPSIPKTSLIEKIHRSHLL